MKISITLSNGSKLEKLFSKSSVIVGRSKFCDFQVLEESLSRQHCEIEFIGGDYYITDLGSSNGVFLDGVKLNAHERTKINTFLQLAIGPFDCRVSDEQTTGLFSSPFKQELSYTLGDLVNNLQLNPPPKNDNIQTRPTRKINPSALNDSKIETVTKKKALKNKLPWYVPLVVVLIFFTAFYYQSTKTNIPNSTPEETGIKIPTYRKDIELLKKIPNEFKSIADYFEENQKKNCLDPDAYCSKMNLSQGSEGTYLDGYNLSIFLVPSLYADDPKYRALSGSRDKLQLIALDKLLTSEPMNQFFQKGSIQIHLVLLNSDNEISEILRFHPLLYNYEKAKRVDAIDLLNVAISTAETKPFWDYLTKFVPKMVIMNN